jgi:hypothetical protein
MQVVLYGYVMKQVLEHLSGKMAEVYLHPNRLKIRPVGYFLFKGYIRTYMICDSPDLISDTKGEMYVLVCSILDEKYIPEVLRWDGGKGCNYKVVDTPYGEALMAIPSYSPSEYMLEKLAKYKAEGKEADIDEYLRYYNKEHRFWGSDEARKRFPVFFRKNPLYAESS